MKKSEALALLKTNPVFWSRLGFCYDPPLADENGEPLVFEKDFSFYLDSHDMFADNGIKLHTSILHSGWVGIDKYDYSLCDRVLDSIFASGKVDYYIPRVKLNVPLDWCKKYPECVCVYEDGPRTAAEIENLVGTLKQDYLGYDSEKGYYNANGYQDTRPNVGGVISLQSFSSKQWLKDAGKALKNLVLHIENGKYADKILAYHIAFGACGESMPWGRQSGKFGDYGIENSQNFLEWGLNKYGSEKALKDAWQIENFENIVPPSSLRSFGTKSEEWFKTDKKFTPAADYDKFTGDCNINAIAHFGKIIKGIAPEKPVGAFYGYILHMDRSAYAGHASWDKMLNNPYVDFFAAPKSYWRCEPGEPGGEMAPTVGINRRKLWLDECDNRTHLTVGDIINGADTAEGTYTVHLRELCKNISHGSGLWYMDLGRGWFNDQGIMNNIKKVTSFSKKVQRLPHRSVAEVLLVADEESLIHSTPNIIPAIESSIRNIQLCGAPIDIVFKEDLPHIDLKKIKLAVFLHTVKMENCEFNSLKKLFPNSCKFLTLSKTGFDNGIKYTYNKQGVVPDFTLSGKIKTVLCEGEDKKPTVCETDDGDFAVGKLPLSVEVARKIEELCGINFYAPCECAVYADSRLVSFFPRKDMSFTFDAGSGNRLLEFGEDKPTNSSEITLNLKAKTGKAFIILS